MRTNVSMDRRTLLKTAAAAGAAILERGGPLRNALLSSSTGRSLLPERAPPCSAISICNNACSASPLDFSFYFHPRATAPGTRRMIGEVDGVLDLDWVHKELAPYYSHTGRPSIDPVLMIRMLIVGYVFAIRSERRLCSEVQVNLAYRWFCRRGIEDGIPDHSVFSRARHDRFRQSDALRRVFEGVVAKCIAAGLVGGEGFSIDASLIRADAGKKKRLPGDQPIPWPRGRRARFASTSLLSMPPTMTRRPARRFEGQRQ